MKRKQLLLLGIFALNLCVGCGNLSLLPAAQSSASDAANCAYGISAACHDDNAPEPALASVQENQKLFAPYAPYGMTYDSAKNQLFYNGKLVRWFEDRYPIEGEDGDEGLYAGADFFCEEGIVDVYATRDLTHLPQNPDGSQDPSGILTGLQEFSQEEFDARNIEAIKNPPITEAIDSEGGELTQ